MRKINIQIKTVNASFEYSPEMELARILHKIANELGSGSNVNNYLESNHLSTFFRNIMDTNGNKVGFMEVKL